MANAPELDSPDGGRLDRLVTLVRAFEAKHTTIGASDLMEVIKFRMEHIGLPPKTKRDKAP